MAMNIHTNVASLTAQRHLGFTNRSVASNIERLSSGYRINSARDDAAGLAISEGMRANIRSLEQAGRNANDVVSLLQTTESAMGDISNVLIRMRELTVQAASDGVTDDQRVLINEEFTQLKEEVSRIITHSTYNRQNLLSGAFASTAAVFQIGADKSDVISVRIGNLELAASANGVIVSASITDASSARTAMDQIDQALENISVERSKLGGVQTRLDLIVDNIKVQHENISAANARIREVDVASEMAAFTKNQILMQAGTSMLAQANMQTQNALSLIG